MSPTSTQIRRQFIDFFVEKCKHTEVPSSPVVPNDDPTLLFANAGMNQFKPYFLGTEQPTFTRAVDTQKCIRAGGKHNDLDDVGKDTYHHTFFEMLGNWSFGDYFKQEAIAWAWELLVDIWGIDPERLHATYFEGDEAEGLAPDLEAKELWLQYLPESRVHPGNKKDNFWEMGDTGPCGPCSELHYDRSPDKNGAALVNADAQDTVVEIWNLVFIQYNRQQSGELVPLPAKHVDTGMGFERIVRVLQGVDSNYDTDAFQPIFAEIQKITGARAYQPGANKSELEDPINIAYRVIADHIRTLTFALSDGAHCTNEGRGYVLRSILRRAVRFGKQTLGVEDPFFYKLVQVVVDNFGGVFPEIRAKQADVEAELKEEEESFRKTLDRGIGLFEEVLTGLAGDVQRPVFPGEEAFKLHDTYGFPIGLTQLMAQERGLTIDLEGFEREMEAARERSRGEGGGVDVRGLLTEWVQKHEPKATKFLGNETIELADSIPVQMIEVDEVLAVVCDQTPFYAEAGGQVGDTGTITIAGTAIHVTDTQKIGDVHFHLCDKPASALPTGEQPVELRVNSARRSALTANHTITHVMNRALRDHVNQDAMQKGSLVDDEKTRFDFSHGGALSAKEIEAVEKQVNDDIAADLAVYTDYAPQEEALKINGLRAVFGEKYPPTVRVVSIGASVADLLADPTSEKWQDLSIEFCGGTHLKKTGDAEGFVIVSQDAVSKGVRRLTAITGKAAHEATAQAEALLHRAEALADAPADQLAEGIDEVTKAMAEQQTPLVLRGKIQAALATLGEKLKKHQKAQASELGEAVVEVARAIAESADDAIICAKVDGADAKSLRTAMDVIRSKKPDAAMMLAADAGEGKVALLASVPKDVIAKGLKAGDWVKHTAPIVGGGGGGRPDMAQAGGKDPAKIDEALEAAKQFAQEKTG